MATSQKSNQYAGWHQHEIPAGSVIELINIQFVANLTATSFPSAVVTVQFTPQIEIDGVIYTAGSPYTQNNGSGNGTKSISRDFTRSAPLPFPLVSGSGIVRVWVNGGYTSASSWSMELYGNSHMSTITYHSSAVPFSHPF